MQKSLAFLFLASIPQKNNCLKLFLSPSLPLVVTFQNANIPPPSPGCFWPPSPRSPRSWGSPGSPPAPLSHPQVEPAPALLIMVNKTLNYWGPGFEEDVININVGGLRRRLSSSALSKFPDTRLGRLLSCDSEESILQLCDDYDVSAREFYFDRNPGFFLYVLHFYQTGKLHVMEELCVFSFCQEIEYWGINEFFLDSCCSYRYHERKLESRHHNWDEESEVSSVDTSPDEISDINHELLRYRSLRCGNARKRLWLTMENPGYSIPSKLFSFVSISVVLVSIATMCIHSMPEYQEVDENGNVLDQPILHKLEYFCISWFTFEVSARLLLSPNPRKFFKHPLNLIDIVSVLPFYFTLLVDVTVGSDSELGNLGKVVQVFRLMRIFRVLKLARHSTGLRSLGATLKVNCLFICLPTPLVSGQEGDLWHGRGMWKSPLAGSSQLWVVPGELPWGGGLGCCLSAKERRVRSTECMSALHAHCTNTEPPCLLHAALVLPPVPRKLHGTALEWTEPGSGGWGCPTRRDSVPRWAERDLLSREMASSCWGCQHQGLQLRAAPVPSLREGEAS